MPHSRIEMEYMDGTVRELKRIADALEKKPADEAPLQAAVMALYRGYADRGDEISLSFAETLRAVLEGDPRVRFDAWGDPTEPDPVVKQAADALIEVHEATGINLYNWPPMLALVRKVYPAWDSDLRSH